MKYQESKYYSDLDQFFAVYLHGNEFDSQPEDYQRMIESVGKWNDFGRAGLKDGLKDLATERFVGVEEFNKEYWTDFASDNDMYAFFAELTAFLFEGGVAPDAIKYYSK